MNIFDINTNQFRQSALHYKLHGTYNFFPTGTKDFNEFWREESRRCIQGYSVGGFHITGYHYFYLNYCPILKVDESSKVNARKVKDFPSFWEVDYEWFNAVAEAEKQGKHLVCVKTRRGGFSYKMASMGVRNYNFRPNSKNFYFASKREFIVGDGIFSKISDYLEFINNDTQNVWYKNRMKKDTSMHKRASYIQDNVEKGFKSELISQVLDDPDKARGKGGDLIVFEEAGSFKDLKKAWQICRPQVEQGSITTGLMIAFGTGGEEGDDIEGLNDMFYEPEAYNILPFENKWDEGMEGTKCGIFIPCFSCTEGFIDNNGKANQEGAKEFWENQRNMISKSSDPKALDRAKAEHPFTPNEALQRVSTNIFPVGEIKLQLSRIKTDSMIQSLIQYGDLFETENNGVEFKPTNSKPIPYPHKPTEDSLTGCIVRYEPPYTIEKTDGDKKITHVPDNLYICVVDPYSKDQAEFSQSLGAAYIIKRQNNVTTQGDIIVASYVARPRTLQMYYNNLFKLAKYYNAPIQSEIEGGGQGIIEYAKRYKLLHMLEYEPDMIHNKELTRNPKNKSYFMKMGQSTKELGLQYLADWLIDRRGITEEGSYIMNLNKIYDEQLLTEMLKYNDIGNFDRVSSMILAMFMLKEKHALEVLSSRKKSSFFNRSFFTNNIDSTNNIWDEKYST